MISRFKQTSARFLLLAILSLGISASALSQIAGGLNETTSTNFGGENFISGTVFGPTGTRVSTRIRIRISAATGGGDVIATTDDQGMFVFSGLKTGFYTVTIDREEGYEPMAQQVEIIQLPNMPPVVQSISFRLKENVKTDSKPAVISSENAAMKRAQGLYAKALELSAKGDNKGAVEQLKLAIAEYPDFVSALTELGIQYLKLNDLEKAEEALQAALKIKPDAFEPLVNRGILLVRAKRFDEAEKVLSAALKAKQDSAVAHFYLGRALANLKRYDEAEKEFNTAILLGGDEMKEAHRMLGSLYLDKGDDKRAVAALEAYLALAPTAPDAEKLRNVIKQLKEQEPSKP